jgi:hypothetical protein
MNILKEDNPILRGPAPCPPGIYRIEDKSMREGQVQLRCTCPHAFVTGCGARVASQHCPILRAGNKMLSLLKKRSRGIWGNLITVSNVSSRRLRFVLCNSRLPLTITDCVTKMAAPAHGY